MFYLLQRRFFLPFRPRQTIEFINLNEPLTWRAVLGRGDRGSSRRPEPPTPWAWFGHAMNALLYPFNPVLGFARSIGANLVIP